MKKILLASTLLFTTLTYAQSMCIFSKSHIISAGGFHSIFADRDLNTYSFGFGLMGQLGVGDRLDHKSPTVTVGMPKIKAVSAGSLESLFLDENGAVWQAGYDLVLGTFTQRKITISALMAGVSVGGYHKLLLSRDGDVYSYGFGYFGQLGSGSRQNIDSPSKVAGLSNMQAISAGGMHSLAYDFNGDAWSFGLGSFGQLGQGNTTSSLTPQKISSVYGISQVSAGEYHSLLMGEMGAVYSFGYGGSGQLGLSDSNTSKTFPTLIAGLPSIKAISAGGRHSLVLDYNGTVWAFGNNSFGQLGLGNLNSTNTPTKIPTLNDVIAISAGQRHSLALDKNGVIWSFGENSNGQLGIGTLVSSSTPQIVSTAARHFDYSYPYAPDTRNCTYQNVFGW